MIHDNYSKNRIQTTILLIVLFGVFLIFPVFIDCSSKKQLPPVESLEWFPRDDDGRTLARVFYCTNRNIEDTSSVSDYFGTQRADLATGHCTISIPKDHEIGVLESPSSLKFWQVMNPNKHVCLQHIQTLDQDSTFNCIARYVHSTPDRKLFLLIHGYNVSFADAARRTGQLANDLQFDGAAVFFSWPSQASVSAYTVDETNSQWTRPHYKQFLLRLLETVKAETVFLMAHSMGNRVLARTLVELVNSGQAEKLTAVKEIIFIAPDIDADDFEDNLAPRITQLGIPVTLYVSSEDKALKASKKVHGYQRAGEKVLVIPGVETIDATFASDDFLGHSYFASSRDIISDLYYLFKDHIRAEKRFGLESKNDEYWMLKK